MRETFEELLEEGRDWLNAFDICLNGEDAQMVKLVEEILTLRRKIDELEKKLAEAVELIDCTSDRWGKCKCRSCKFLESLEEKEAQGEG